MFDSTSGMHEVTKESRWKQKVSPAQADKFFKRLQSALLYGTALAPRSAWSVLSLTARATACETCLTRRARVWDGWDASSHHYGGQPRVERRAAGGADGGVHQAVEVPAGACLRALGASSAAMR
jgi:hypothetical protein